MRKSFFFLVPLLMLGDASRDSFERDLGAAGVKVVALGFHGEYHRRQELFHLHGEGCSNFFNDAANISAALKEPLEAAGVGVLTLVSTVGSCPSLDQQLLDELKPVSHAIAACRLPRIMDSYLEVMSLAENHDPVPTHIVLTRFDVRYRLPIHEMDIKWDKLNLAFPDGPVYWEKERKVSDLFHVFPYRYLVPLRRAMEATARRTGAAHWIYKPLAISIGPSSMNFVDKEGHRSNMGEHDEGLSFVYIDRSCQDYDALCSRSDDVAPLCKSPSVPGNNRRGGRAAKREPRMKQNHRLLSGSIWESRASSFSTAAWKPGVIGAGKCFFKSHKSEEAYCLPSVLGIGAMKAGSSELFLWMNAHPMLHGPHDQELHFFGEDEHHGGFGMKPRLREAAERYVTKPTDNEWLLTRNQIEKGDVTFEKAPYYLSSVEAAAQILQLLGPSIKLVAILRDPVDRAYSAFMHHCASFGNIRLDSKARVVFDSSCHLQKFCCCSQYDMKPHQSPLSKAPCTPQSFDQYLKTTEKDEWSQDLGTILNKGLYARELEKFLAIFDRSQFLLLDFEVFRKDPAGTTNNVFAFVGVSPFDFSPLMRQSDRGLYYLDGSPTKAHNAPHAPMLESSRAFLEEFYRDAGLALSRLFPHMKFSWNQKAETS